MIQRGMQSRFYEYPDFHYTEIYSFYSASRQGGLILTDVDGDGRPDIICGNYWARSPERFDLPWHIYAINVQNEQLYSATFHLSLDGRDLIAAQAEVAGGHVWRYRKPADTRRLWIETDLGEFHRPAGIMLRWRGRPVPVGTDAPPKVHNNEQHNEARNNCLCAFVSYCRGGTGQRGDGVKSGGGEVSCFVEASKDSRRRLAPLWPKGRGSD
jgi:hypothetical protein